MLIGGAGNPGSGGFRTSGGRACAPWRRLSGRFQSANLWPSLMRPQHVTYAEAQYCNVEYLASARSRADRAAGQRHAASVVGSNRPLPSAGETDWVVATPICAPRDGPVCTSRDVGSGSDFQKSLMNQWRLGVIVHGGGRGIRTLETVTRLHAFQACAFDHSATPPKADPFGRSAQYTQKPPLSKGVAPVRLSAVPKSRH
jgi:hypothetical protein